MSGLFLVKGTPRPRLGSDDAAAELRERLEPMLSEIGAVLDQAIVNGFLVSFTLEPAPPLNKHRAVVTIVKHF
jgi:hypothetical protein